VPMWQSAKLGCLPIGIENRYNKHGAHPELYIPYVGARSTRTPFKLLLVDFTPDSKKPGRQEAFKALSKQAYTSTRRGMSKSEWWEAVIEHKWVASPHGHGLDCHRTWEVLLAGGYVVVKSSVLDSLYEQLPVLIVDSWDNISAQLLETTFEEFSRRKFGFDRLFLPFWSDKIHGAALKSAILPLPSAVKPRLNFLDVSKESVPITCVSVT